MGLWPFGAKKTASAPVANAPPQITRREIATGLSALFARRFPLLYGIMNGYPHELADHFDELQEAIQKDPKFTNDRVTAAVGSMISGAEYFCRMDEESFNRMFSTQRAAGSAEIDALRLEIYRLGPEELFKAVDFDATDWLMSSVLEWRNADLQAIADKLTDRELYLRPLLMRARSTNKYGEIDWKGYFKELSEFAEAYFPPGTLIFFNQGFPLMRATEMIEHWFAPPAAVAEMPANGVDFEHWCAAQIELQGWSVRVSKASGDQGIDVEAMRPGLTVAVQCKRYTTPIGNKAVQEAFAGVTHYKADIACVIGTGGFTPSAQQLALSTGVVLIDASSIADFTSLVDRR